MTKVVEYNPAWVFPRCQEFCNNCTSTSCFYCDSGSLFQPLEDDEDD